MVFLGGGMKSDSTFKATPFGSSINLEPPKNVGEHTNKYSSDERPRNWRISRRGIEADPSVKKGAQRKCGLW